MRAPGMADEVDENRSGAKAADDGLEKGEGKKRKKKKERKQ